MALRYIRKIGSHKRAAALILLLLVVAGVLAALELTNTTHLLHKEPKVASAGSFNTKGEKKSDKSSSDESKGQSTAENPPASDKSTGSGTSAPLFAPTGNFVSSHHPSLSTANAMASVCNTTPGASCKITFTQNDTVKSLPSQTADANGSVYWNWKLQDIGLSTGSWKIEAFATLNSQTKTASDAMQLEVSP